ncbi:MAG TPA: hypothetical protein VEI97_11290 [bacterium]|nr:hypothetical protein [bacterium]
MSCLCTRPSLESPLIRDEGCPEHGLEGGRWRRAYSYDLFGVECGKGWARLYRPLLVEALEKGWQVHQVKEKWGFLRMYAAGDEAFLAKIDEAEARSGEICEDCGVEGEEAGVARRPAGWIRTLCLPCFAVWQGRR